MQALNIFRFSFPFSVTADGERTGEIPQAEHTAWAEHYRAETETEGHGEGDAHGETEGERPFLFIVVSGFSWLGHCRPLTDKKTVVIETCIHRAYLQILSSL